MPEQKKDFKEDVSAEFDKSLETAENIAVEKRVEELTARIENINAEMAELNEAIEDVCAEEAAEAAPEAEKGAEEKEE